MAGFTEQALTKKLADLNNSQQSIQTLSLWLIHHRKHHKIIVDVWFQELTKAKSSKKLTFMYLANDVIQNSKKKGPEFGKEFGRVLRKCFEDIVKNGCEDKTRTSLERILAIWEDRGVYDSKQIKEFRLGFSGDTEEKSQPSKKKYKPAVVEANAVHRITSSPTPAVNHSKSPPRKRKHSETEIDHDGTKEIVVTLSPRTPAREPPEPEELIQALTNLENGASADVNIREKIAKLPPEVSEVKHLATLDKVSAQRLSEQVNEAVDILQKYNKRLADEMDERRRITTMFKDFIQAQQELLDQGEQRLEEYKDKLFKVCSVRSELQSHLRNLPDLTQLPDVTGGLPPLPSAGDLFSFH